MSEQEKRLSDKTIDTIIQLDSLGGSACGLPSCEERALALRQLRADLAYIQRQLELETEATGEIQSRIDNAPEYWAVRFGDDNYQHVGFSEDECESIAETQNENPEYLSSATVVRVRLVEIPQPEQREDGE